MFFKKRKQARRINIGHERDRGARDKTWESPADRSGIRKKRNSKGGKYNN